MDQHPDGVPMTVLERLDWAVAHPAPRLDQLAYEAATEIRRLQQQIETMLALMGRDAPDAQTYTTT